MPKPESGSRWEPAGACCLDAVGKVSTPWSCVISYSVEADSVLAAIE